jgi:hypothetical protein
MNGLLLYHLDAEGRRPAVLMPTRALQLEFKDGGLIQHGYRAIVLGHKL